MSSDHDDVVMSYLDNRLFLAAYLAVKLLILARLYTLECAAVAAFDAVKGGHGVRLGASMDGGHGDHAVALNVFTMVIGEDQAKMGGSQ